MIKSMTGFGRCEVADGERRFTVEIKSVNHRYLDANIRMPKKFNFFEAAIRSLLKQYASRGKVDIFITYEDLSESQMALKYNETLAKEYLDYFKKCRRPSGWRMISVSLRCLVIRKCLRWKSSLQTKKNSGTGLVKRWKELLGSL